MKNLTNSNIVKEIIENVKDDMQNEEIIHLVLEKQISHYDLIAKKQQRKNIYQ